MEKSVLDKSKVPFFKPWITNEDKKNISNSLNSTLLTAGPKLEKFEKEFAKMTGTKYAVGVSNGTAALQLSLRSLGIGKGDEVIIPDMTFIATASAVINNHAIPVLADIDKESFNISIESIKEKITEKTKAILPVHFAGKSCNMKKIVRIAKENNLFVIEDCAHAIGTKHDGKHVGTFGNAGCFSFYPTKNITTIEGGMIITNSRNVAQYIRSARNHGMTRSLMHRYSKGYPWDYDVVEAGYNYRLDEIRASLGLSQLKRLVKLNELRRKACRYYNSKLQDIKGIITPTVSSDDSCHLYIIRIQKEYKNSRNSLYKKLLRNRIQTTVHYKPLHQFTLFKKKAIIHDKLTNSKRIYNESLSLPLFPQITRRQQNTVVRLIRD